MSFYYNFLFMDQNIITEIPLVLVLFICEIQLWALLLENKLSLSWIYPLPVLLRSLYIFKNNKNRNCVIRIEYRITID